MFPFDDIIMLSRETNIVYSKQFGIKMPYWYDEMYVSSKNKAFEI